MIVAMADGPARSGVASGTRNGSSSKRHCRWRSRWTAAGKDHAHGNQKQQHAAGDVQRGRLDSQEVHQHRPEQQEEEQDRQGEAAFADDDGRPPPLLHVLQVDQERRQVSDRVYDQKQRQHRRKQVP